MLLLQMVHFSIEVVQVFISQQGIVGKIELSPSVVERVIIPNPWKVEPLERTLAGPFGNPQYYRELYLWMSEFIAFEIKVTFSTQ